MRNKEKILVANWKTYLNSSAAIKEKLFIFLTEFKNIHGLIICLPSIYLSQAKDILSSSNITLGAQQVSISGQGIATGHIFSSMLLDMGCDYVIVGHSEVRGLLRESNAMVVKKSEEIIAKHMIPIICIGESEEIRNSGEYLDFLEQQISESLPSNFQDFEFIIAYEPIWAIGTGKVPTNAEIQEIIELIRGITNKKILYGGSVSEKNSQKLAQIKGLDGFLIGGASIHSDKLIKIWHHLNKTQL